MRRYFVIRDHETLRVVNDPLRMQLLGGLITREETGKQIADRLGLSPSRVHYHLKELEHNGLIAVQRTEEKNGIVQKFYRAVAYDFLIDEELLPIVHAHPTLYQDVLVTQMQMAIARIHATPASAFPVLAQSECSGLPLSGAFEFKVNPHALKEWILRYHDLIAELQTMEEAQAQQDGNREPGQVFFLQTLGFMTPEKYFVSDNDEIPAGYQWVSRGIVRRSPPAGEGR